uniref:Putative secreted protein n=1 Tax=Anopheles marajoara TaxID=58244 RepID=A0A2M4CCT6_9DIPT
MGACVILFTISLASPSWPFQIHLSILPTTVGKHTKENQQKNKQYHPNFNVAQCIVGMRILHSVLSRSLCTATGWLL